MEIKYGGKLSTHIQVVLEKFNTLSMDEDSSVVDHVNHIAPVANICQLLQIQSWTNSVSTILNSLPHSWDSVVTSVKVLKLGFEHGFSSCDSGA